MAYAQARPKRAAEDFARTHHDSDFSGQASKKPRFDVRNPSALAPDALEEDATLEADVIGKRGQQVRRKAVNVDGYDSDSENENFNTRAEVKARQNETASKSKAEEDSDMFADLEADFKDGDDSEGDEKRRGPGRKAVRFLNTDEIEGQVASSRSGGHVSADFRPDAHGKGMDGADVDSSSESEIDDETRASTGGLDDELGAGSKKTHAPKLDAFNMKNENEEGRFDDQGNYVRKAIDPDAVHDSWLEGVSKKEMRKAKEAHEKREQDRRQRDIEDDSQATADVLKRLIPLMEGGETVLEALARLGKQKDKAKKWQRKKVTSKADQGRDSMPDSGSAMEFDASTDQRKRAIETITEAADMLLTRGQTEIYETERELLTRQYRREAGEDWVEHEQASTSHAAGTGPGKWEYRWSDARDGGDAHGPYDGETMKQWRDAGYFGDGVEFRQQDSGDTWHRHVEFV